jgi:Do/DeqQ family serine protease
MTPTSSPIKPPATRWSVIALSALIGSAAAGLWNYSNSRAGASPLTAAPVAAVTPATTEAVSRASQLSDAFASVAESVSPSVVTIKIEAKQEMPQAFRIPFFGGDPDQQRQQGIVKGSGSGVVFRSDGAILTNNHVVEHATRITVVLKDGRNFRAKVAGTDPAVDLAVLKIDAKNLPAATFGDSAKARVGEWVLAIGAPFGLDYTLTAGVVSAKGRGIGANQIEDYLQTDASINPGNSGGPLVDLNGRVLGINTVIIGGSGIGFAIPSNLARGVGEQLLANGKVRRAWLGVSFQELSADLAQNLGKDDTHGALVASVIKDGPAARAGIRPGDVIERVDSDVVGEGKDLLRAVLARPVGSDVTLSVRRDSKVQAIKVKTTERPDDMNSTPSDMTKSHAAPSELGLQLQALTPDIAQQIEYQGAGKVVVAGVRPGSPADEAGLQRGDVIVEADRRAVKSPDDVANAAKDGKAMLLVERKGGSMFVMLNKE